MKSKKIAASSAVIAIMAIFVIFAMSARAFAGRFTVQADSQGRVVAPFGFPSSQPPPRGSVINLADHQIGLEAQQVCGYTDWSTIQLRLPKKLRLWCKNLTTTPIGS
jgi:hypothetical protein